MALEQIFPDRRPVDPAAPWGELDLSPIARSDRPHVVASMVVAIGGRATAGGGTTGLSSEIDRRLFLGLRAHVDAVMAGPKTIEMESYGPLARSEERRAERRGRGLEPVPLAVTATRTLALPVETPLFRDRASRIVVLTSSDREPPAAAATLLVERLEGDDLDLAAGLARLRAAHGVRSVLMEGGPTLLGAMLRAGVVDELFLTFAPMIAGGRELGLVEAAELPEPVSLTLESVLREGDEVFVRYRIKGE